MKKDNIIKYAFLSDINIDTISYSKVIGNNQGFMYFTSPYF